MGAELSGGKNHLIEWDQLEKVTVANDRVI